jgi:biopolymer transport protein TolR
MAVFIKPSSGAKTSRRAFAPVAEINVTPLVDVMLVLLVIFIVTAPLLTTGVNVNLPQTSRAKSLPQDNTALTLTVERDGQVTLNAAKQDAVKLDMETLRGRLAAIREANADIRVYVKGDKDVPYGFMMEVMAEVTAAGITQVAFVTEPKKTMRSPR